MMGSCLIEFRITLAVAGALARFSVSWAQVRLLEASPGRKMLYACLAA